MWRRQDSALRKRRNNRLSPHRPANAIGLVRIAHKEDRPDVMSYLNVPGPSSHADGPKCNSNSFAWLLQRSQGHKNRYHYVQITGQAVYVASWHCTECELEVGESSKGGEEVEPELLPNFVHRDGYICKVEKFSESADGTVEMQIKNEAGEVTLAKQLVRCSGSIPGNYADCEAKEMTPAKAKQYACILPDCVGFCYANCADDVNTMIYFKSQYGVCEDSTWTNYRISDK